MTADEEKKLLASAEAPGTTDPTQKVPTNGYQSKWDDQINDIFGKIQNREPFKYDVNADALYEQYKNQYINNGRLAMEDTIGQAATLTGGYDNSYAHSIGQQTYNRYLEGLNDRVPELYQIALERYMNEGDDLMKEYGLLVDRDNLDYGRYQDAADLAKSQIEAMIELGVRPSDDLIRQSGLSREYIEAILNQFAGGGGENGSGSSGGSGGGGRGGSSGGNGNGSAGPAGGNFLDDDIDYDSIINLGYGPISEGNLAGKVYSGDVTMHQKDNGQLGFVKTPDKTTDSGWKPLATDNDSQLQKNLVAQDKNKSDKKWWEFWK